MSDALEETDIEIYADLSDTRAGAFFYVPRPEPRGLMDLVRAAGMPRAGHKKLANVPEAEIAIGEWGPVVGALARRREYSRHVALEIFFSFYDWSEFYEGTDYRARATHPVEEDPALPLAHAFRDTCLRLDSEVGVLTLNNMVSDTEYQEKEVYPLVLEENVYRLAAWAGLLYLNDDLKDLLLGTEELERQDQLPIERGLLLFGGRGVKRWH